MILPPASLYRYTPGARGKSAACSRSWLTGQVRGNYTKSMSCGQMAAVLWMLAIGLAVAQPPPEEDKSLATQVFSFNPVQSEHEVAIGDQYFSKGNYTAAISRYAAATKWNDGNAKRNSIR